MKLSLFGAVIGAALLASNGHAERICLSSLYVCGRDAQNPNHRHDPKTDPDAAKDHDKPGASDPDEKGDTGGGSKTEGFH